MSSPALLSDSDVELVESEPQDLVCTECKKSITDDPARCLGDINDSLFLSTKPDAESDKSAVVICGECAFNIVVFHLSRSGRV